MSSEEQDSEGADSKSKIEIANVGNDESTTVDKYVQFEIQPVEAGFLTKLRCKVGIGIGFTETILHPIPRLVDTGARPSLFTEDYLKRRWKCCTWHPESSNIKSATKAVIKINSVISHFVRVGDLQFSIRFGILQTCR